MDEQHCESRLNHLLQTGAFRDAKLPPGQSRRHFIHRALKRWYKFNKDCHIITAKRTWRQLKADTKGHALLAPDPNAILSYRTIPSTPQTHLLKPAAAPKERAAAAARPLRVLPLRPVGRLLPEPHDEPRVLQPAAAQRGLPPGQREAIPLARQPAPPPEPRALQPLRPRRPPPQPRAEAAGRRLAQHRRQPPDRQL
ncbi:hypothetical protein V492_00707 [Pseudogymnoascus sp. VKM F-4246]|nr:hypothetical protein V492_00707 [Pseudogymnoascus sp. VKM F-4246]